MSGKFKLVSPLNKKLRKQSARSERRQDTLLFLEEPTKESAFLKCISSKIQDKPWEKTNKIENANIISGHSQSVIYSSHFSCLKDINEQRAENVLAPRQFSDSLTNKHTNIFYSILNHIEIHIQQIRIPPTSCITSTMNNMHPNISSTQIITNNILRTIRKQVVVQQK